MITRRNIGQSFVDLLFIISLGFLLLLFVMLPFLNPTAKSGAVDPPVMLMVELTWDDESNKDMDLYTKGPDGAVVNYGNKENGYITLSRDDLGTSNDKFTINGETILVRRNYEIITLTAMPEGSYVINVHYFSFSGPTETVKVRVTNLSNFGVVYDGDIVLVPRKEVTALVFKVVNKKIVGIRTDIQVKFRRDK